MEVTHGHLLVLGGVVNGSPGFVGTVHRIYSRVSSFVRGILMGRRFG
jgi:hypothetical protein